MTPHPPSLTPSPPPLPPSLQRTVGRESIVLASCCVAHILLYLLRLAALRWQQARARSRSDKRPFMSRRSCLFFFFFFFFFFFSLFWSLFLCFRFCPPVTL